MGIFTRRAREPRDGPVVATQGQETTTRRSGFGLFNRNRNHSAKSPLVMNMATRPTFGQWLKVTWLDIVTMAIMGMIGLGVS